jgi:hypothetical protein
MVTLFEIKNALEHIDAEDGDTDVSYIGNAISSLKTAQEAMNTISVRGRNNLDALLGCMMAIDLIIGEEKDGRQNNK